MVPAWLCKILFMVPERYTLFVGDDVSMLVYSRKHTLLQRWVIPHDATRQARLAEYAALDKKAPFVILIDTLEQNYNLQSFPAVDRFSIQGLVNKRLEREYAAQGFLRGSLMVDKQRDGNKEWHYMLVACPYGGMVQTWIQDILALPNPLQSISLFPAETERLLHALTPSLPPIAGAARSASNPASTGSPEPGTTDTPTRTAPAFTPANPTDSGLKTATAPAATELNEFTEDAEDAEMDSSSKRAKKAKGPAQTLWQMLIIHNKISGFRQVAFKNGKIMFTRLIAQDPDATAEASAAYTMYEVQSSLEYLKRFGLQDRNSLQLCCIASSEILTHMVAQEKHCPVIGYTPAEAAALCKVHAEGIANDRFADATCAIALTWLGSPKLPLSTPIMRRLATLEKSATWSILSSYLTLPVLFCTMVTMFVQQYSTRTSLKGLDSQLAQANTEWEALSKITYDDAMIKKVREMEHINDFLGIQHEPPMRVLQTFMLAKGDDVTVKGFSWDLNDANDENNAAALPTTPQPSGAQPQLRYQIVASFDATLENHYDSYEVLFNNFSTLIEKLRAAFHDYEFTYTRSTEHINLQNENTESNIIPVRITVRKTVNATVTPATLAVQTTASTPNAAAPHASHRPPPKHASESPRATPTTEGGQ